MRGRILLSVATAALIVTGFSGCNVAKSTDTKTDAVVNQIEQHKYTTTIKGVVLDDAGNPVKGAKVYIGNKRAITNEGGQYQIDGVDVSNYVALKNGSPRVVQGNGDRITVSIIPPANTDMVPAVVTVTPKMIHIENYGNDHDDTGDINTQPESQSFTIMAESVMAVLPHKAAKIKAVIRDTRTGQPVPAGTKVTAVWKSLSDNAVAISQNEQIGVNSVVGYVGADGTVQLNGLLTSSEYEFVVEGYGVANSNVEANGENGYNVDGTLKGLIFTSDNVTSYADKDYITNLGNILVTPVKGEDEIAPMLAFDTNANGVGDGVYSYIHTVLEDQNTRGVVYAPGIDGSAEHPFVVNFTEPLKNTVTKDDVMIYDVTHQKVLNVASVNLVNNGQTLEIVTEEPVAENTQIQIRLFRAKFRDLADNVLVDSNAIDDRYTGPGNSYVALNASTYFKVNTTLTPVADIRELNATTVDLLGNGYANKAMSTVTDVAAGTVPSTLYQMNDNADSLALRNLAHALNNSVVSVNNQTARIAFTPDENVTDYYVRVFNQNGQDVTNYSNIRTTEDNPQRINNSNIVINGGRYVDLKDSTGLLHNEFLVENVRSGYVVKIYPVNGFGDLGEPTSITLQDNVPLTTVLNQHYNPYIDSQSSGASGNTGDLIDITNASGTGLPILHISSNMLKSSAGASNDDLRTTLTGSDKVYDAEDFANFNKERTIGIEVSEPINSNDVITDYLKVYDANGDEVNNIESAQFVTLNGGHYAVAFKVKDIIDMQKYSKVSIAGIHDKAGNVADSMAADKIVDNLPPMVVEANATQKRISIKFTEPISLTDANGNGYRIPLRYWWNGWPLYYIDTYSDGTIKLHINTTYYDEHGNDLSGGTDIPLTVVKDGSDGELVVELPDTYNGVDLSNLLVSKIHGVKDANGVDNALARGYSILDIDFVNDVHHNRWASDNYLSVEPKYFAMADNIAPKINFRNAVINPNDAADNQLKLAIWEVDNGDVLNIGQDDTNDNWEVGDNTANNNNNAENYKVRIQFREPIAYWDGGWKLFSNNADMNVVASDSNTHYTIPASQVDRVKAVNDTIIEVDFTLDSGEVKAGDKLEITGIKDASGNETNVTITLKGAGDGISVNTEAYK